MGRSDVALTETAEMLQPAGGGLMHRRGNKSVGVFASQPRAWLSLFWRKD